MVGIYEAALKQMRVKNIPTDPLAQAMLFNKLNEKRVPKKKVANGFNPQRATWGNKGEGY